MSFNSYYAYQLTDFIGKSKGKKKIDISVFNVPLISIRLHFTTHNLLKYKLKVYHYNVFHFVLFLLFLCVS